MHFTISCLPLRIYGTCLHTVTWIGADSVTIPGRGDKPGVLWCTATGSLDVLVAVVAEASCDALDRQPASLVEIEQLRQSQVAGRGYPDIYLSFCREKPAVPGDVLPHLACIPLHFGPFDSRISPREWGVEWAWN